MNFTQEKPSPSSPRAGLLAWPAWQRVLALLPVLALLWLAVIWAGGPAA